MTPRPLPRLEVEPLFDRVVAMMGGRRVTDIVGPSPSFENADYVFEVDRVVAELKVLEKDLSSDQKTRDRIREMYERWASEGRVPALPQSGKFTISLTSLPEDLRREFIKPFRASLQTPVKKAGQQIRQTREKLGMSDAHGILLLVNDANPVFSPDVTFNLLYHLLKTDHRAIHHVVYCGINLPVKLGSSEIAGPLFSSAAVPNRDSVPETFLNRLARCVGEALNQSYGLTLPTLSVLDEQVTELGQMSFDRTADAQRRELYLLPGMFYRSRALGHRYYCDAVANGTARIYLVESYRNGKLIQALFDQKAIWSEDYEPIKDQAECKRLREMLVALKRSK